MKTEAIQKINKVGKISYILAVICKIFVIVGLVCVVIGGAVWLTLPESAVKVTRSSNMFVEMDQEALGDSFSVEEFEKMADSLESGEEWQITQTRNGMMSPKLEFFSTKESYQPVAVSVDGNRVNMQLVSEEMDFTMRHVGVLMLMFAVVFAMTIVTLTFVEKLCKAFRDCESPFEENVIWRMQRLAKCLIPWIFVSSLGESVIGSLMAGNMKVTLSLDLGVVLMVVIVLILVYVFKYGAVLQQESDETL